MNGALLGPLIFHGLNFLTGLIAVDQLASLGLQETFLNVGREGVAFFLGPAHRLPGLQERGG